MSIQIFIIIGLVVAFLGSIIGASMVVTQQRATPTERPQRSEPPPDYNRPSQRKLFLPMVSFLGVSLFLLIVGYAASNIVAASVGFLLLFLGFGLLGSFLFNKIL